MSKLTAESDSESRVHWVLTESGLAAPLSVASDIVSLEKPQSGSPDETESPSASVPAGGRDEGSTDDDLSVDIDPVPESIPLDQVFEILKNARRRETLHYLRDHDGEATLSDLAEHIAALENDISIAALSSKQRKRVYVGLYQCHLPKMDDTGVIEFNQHRGTVRLSDCADQLYEYLEEPETGSWHRVYGAIALVGTGLLVTSLMTDLASQLLLTVLLAGLIVSVGCCAIAEVYLDEYP